jgi:hypothetical protein
MEVVADRVRNSQHKEELRMKVREAIKVLKLQNSLKMRLFSNGKTVDLRSWRTSPRT